MRNADRPVDLATLVIFDCTGCDWLLMADGDAALDAATYASLQHAAHPGHEVTTARPAAAEEAAQDPLATILGPGAVPVPGGYAMSKGGPGD